MFQPSKKGLFFYTDRESLNTFVYFKRADETEYKRRVYMPDAHECMTNAQIQVFRKRTNLRFLAWAFKNKNKITDASDRKIVTSQLIDVNAGLLGSASLSYLLFKLSGRIESSFLEIFLDDKFMRLNTLRLISSLGVFAYGLRYTYNNILGEKFLYDLALEHKEQFQPASIRDSHVENIIAEYLLPFQKLPKAV